MTFCAALNEFKHTVNGVTTAESLVCRIRLCGAVLSHQMAGGCRVQRLVLQGVCVCVCRGVV